MKTERESESGGGVGSSVGLGRWSLFYLLLALTSYNIIFDWALNRLGPLTIAWEGGVVTAITWVWFLKRPNAELTGDRPGRSVQ